MYIYVHYTIRLYVRLYSLHIYFIQKHTYTHAHTRLYIILPPCVAELPNVVALESENESQARHFKGSSSIYIYGRARVYTLSSQGFVPRKCNDIYIYMSCTRSCRFQVFKIFTRISRPRYYAVIVAMLFIGRTRRYDPLLARLFDCYKIPPRQTPKCSKRLLRISQIFVVID